MKHKIINDLRDNHHREHMEHQPDVPHLRAGNLNPFEIIKQHQEDCILEIIDNLNIKKGSRALDVGCGEGSMSANLLQRGFEVVAIDKSEEMIKVARKNCETEMQNGKISFWKANVEEMDLDAEPYDIIIAIDLIQYLSFDRWVLQVMSRLLNPGGTIIITAPNLIGLANITDPILISSFLLKVMKWFMARVKNKKLFNCIIFKKLISAFTKYPKKNFYLSSRLNRWFEEIDCPVVELKTHGFGPFRPLWPFTFLSLHLNKSSPSGATSKKIPFLSKLGNDFIFVARKVKHPHDLTKNHIFKNMEDRIRKFERKEKSYFDCPYFSQLDSWQKANHEYLDLSIERLKHREAANHNIIVLSPHPDDELIGCGGTMMRMLDERAALTILYLTDGCRGSSLNVEKIPEKERHIRRFKETEEVGKKLGVNDLIYWLICDGELRITEENIHQLTNILNRYQPKFIFTPFINDIHPDHVATNDLLEKALSAGSLDLNRLFVLSYEVWSKVPVNAYCNIDNQFYKKGELLMEYRTALKDWNHIFSCQSMHQYNAWKLINRKGFIEVFFQLNGANYVEFIRSANRI